MISRSIDLFIVKNLTIKGHRYGGAFLQNLNCIILDLESLGSLDWLFSILTHELIHYCLEFKVSNLYISDQIIDIDDSCLLRLSYEYNDLSKEDFYKELIACTYQKFPNALQNYFLNEDNTTRIYKDFGVSKKRKSTIEFICEHKLIPLYKENE